MVNPEKVYLVLGSNNRKIMELRFAFALEIIENRKDGKIIFTGTREEVDWMFENSKIDAVREDRSKTTVDNLLNSRKIFNSPGEIFIITDMSHAPRTRYLAGRIFRNIKIEILARRMPLKYLFRRFFYEFPRFIENALQ